MVALADLYIGWDGDDLNDFSGSVAAYAESGNRLIFSASQASSGQYNIAHNVTDSDLDESSLHVTLEAAANQSFESELFLYHGGASGNDWIALRWSGYENRFRITTFDGSSTVTHYNVLNPTRPFDIRVVETGGTTTVDTSPHEAETWTNRASFTTLTDHTAIQLGWESFTSDDGDTGTVEWGIINPAAAPGGGSIVPVLDSYRRRRVA